MSNLCCRSASPILPSAQFYSSVTIHCSSKAIYFVLSAGEGGEEGVCGLIADSSPGQCVQLKETSQRSLAVLAGGDCNWCIFPGHLASAQPSFSILVPKVSITRGLCPHPKAAVKLRPPCCRAFLAACGERGRAPCSTLAASREQHRPSVPSAPEALQCSHRDSTKAPGQ